MMTMRKYVIIEEVLKHMPKRSSKKNGEHVLDVVT